MSETVQVCINHPRRDTRVRCSSCASPICVACMRQSAVGMKCPECARLPRRALALGTPRHYLGATGAGLGAAIVTGAASGLMRLPLSGLILGFLAGWVIGEAVSRGASGRGGAGFQVIAVLVSVAGLSLGRLAVSGSAGLLLTPGGILGLGIAAGFAALRVGRRS